MLTLGIDASTEMAAIALASEERLIAETNLSLYRRHSERLLANISHIFSELDYDIKDLDLIAVGIGPGSYTGLRIALSTVKAFAMALNIPVVALSTLEILAYNYKNTEAIIVPMLDAKRKRVYTNIYDNYKKDKDFVERKLWEDKTLSLEKLIAGLKEIENIDNKEILLIGNATLSYKEDLKKADFELKIASSSLNYIKGSTITDLGIDYYEKGVSHNISTLTPKYLKKAQAEINYKKIGSE